MVKITKNDILYYIEHETELPTGNDMKKRKKALKKIKKRKETESGEKLKKSQLGSFVIEIKTIIQKIKEKKLSKDELKKKIDSFLKTPTPSLSPSPESLGSLKGLNEDELEMELIKRNREAIA